MSIVVALILGAVVGWLAGKVGGREEGVVASMLIGVAGAFIGGIVSHLLTGNDQAYLAFSWSGLLWSFVGAVILVITLNALQRRPHHNV